MATDPSDQRDKPLPDRRASAVRGSGGNDRLANELQKIQDGISLILFSAPNPRPPEEQCWP